MKRITVLLLIMIMVLTNAGLTFAYANETVLPIKAELFAAEEPEISFTVSEKITAENTNPDDPTQLSYSDLIIRNNASPLQLDSISASGTESCTLVADSSIDKAEANSFSMTAAICDNSQDLGAATANTFTTNRRIARDATLTVNFSGRYALPEADTTRVGANLTLTFSKFEADYLILESENPFYVQVQDTGYLWLSFDGKNSDSYTNSWAVWSSNVMPVTYREDSQSTYMLCVKGEHPNFGYNRSISIISENDANDVVISGSLLGLMGVASCPIEYLFAGCTAIKDASDLVFPDTIECESAYCAMFYGCTSLEYAPKLPATTLKDSCYASMFENCTSLKTVPELPATTLMEGCYNSMFKGCTSLKLSKTQTGEYKNAYRIPTSGTGTEGSYALNSMFANTGGSFTGTPAINTTYYTSNTIVG